MPSTTRPLVPSCAANSSAENRFSLGCASTTRDHHFSLNAFWVESSNRSRPPGRRTRAVTQGLSDPISGETPDLLAEGLALVGSPDTVTGQLEQLLERLPLSWLFAWTYNGLIPHAALLRSIELFATQVLPRVADLETGRYAQPGRQRRPSAKVGPVSSELSGARVA